MNSRNRNVPFLNQVTLPPSKDLSNGHHDDLSVNILLSFTKRGWVWVGGQASEKPWMTPKFPL